VRREVSRRFRSADLRGLCTPRRFYIQQLLKSDPVVSADDIKVKQTVARAQRLRRFGRFVTLRAYAMRKQYFIRKEGGVLKKDPPVNPMSNPMTNPMAMMDGMKGNISYIVPNMVMMTFISYFFSGFVLVKVPFDLTNRFKVMLQRGVDLSTLDVSYVSSLSWYFLLMYGLRSVFRLVLGDDEAAQEEQRMMQMQMGMGMGGMGGGMNAPQPKALYKQESTSLKIHSHKCVLDDVEQSLLGDRYPSVPSLDDDIAKIPEPKVLVKKSSVEKRRKVKGSRSRTRKD